MGKKNKSTGKRRERFPLLKEVACHLTDYAVIPSFSVPIGKVALFTKNELLEIIDFARALSEKSKKIVKKSGITKDDFVVALYTDFLPDDFELEVGSIDLDDKNNMKISIFSLEGDAECDSFSQRLVVLRMPVKAPASLKVIMHNSNNMVVENSFQNLTAIQEIPDFMMPNAVMRPVKPVPQKSQIAGWAPDKPSKS